MTLEACSFNCTLVALTVTLVALTVTIKVVLYWNTVE